MRTRTVVTGVLLTVAVWTALPAEVPEDRGAMGLSQALQRLDVVASVLHTGAHPDDENSGLLAWLSRGQGARSAYLSPTRGDGGQNLLGTELFEALGVIRNVPNKISAADFDGWVQERGTYFPRTFDPRYTPLLESGDPREMPLQGGLVSVRYGKGTYTYTGYVFFRELQAGVKGAYRLFANLVSLEAQ